MTRRVDQPATKETPKQASAWLRTVLHPLWRVAQITRNRLAHANPSYRAYARDFEFLGPSEAAISPVFRLNYDHFAKRYPDIAGRIRAYDEALAELRQACQVADDALREHPTLRALADEHAERSPGGIAGYLAEYTINGLTELPPDYALRDVWAAAGPVLLALRDGDLRSQFARADAAKTRLLEAAARLDDALRDLTLDMADRHGLPPVDPDALAS